jgi:hypothetical protein
MTTFLKPDFSFNSIMKLIMKLNIKVIAVITLLIFILPVKQLSAQITDKHRLIVLTDIEADPDDSQTLIRLLLYSNQIDIEGLIATTSTHQRKWVFPQSIREIVKAYGQVQPNLLKHEPGFPAAEKLLVLVKQGLPVYGMEGVGEGKDSEGSQWIIKVLEEDDDRPVWVSVWGGPNTLAQALWNIRQTRSNAEADRLIAKLRVYTISDQDDSGPWMRKEFPGLFYIVSVGGGYGSATWSAIRNNIKGIDNYCISNEWITKNIQEDHGPLGAKYPDVAYGMEGDTPSWLNLILNGLSNPERPDWGGWGGRYEYYKPEPQSNANSRFPGRQPAEPETRPIWTNARDKYTPRVPNQYGCAIRKDTITFTDNQVTLWRWRNDFQNDFAARMDWCTKSYEEVNHPPVPHVNGPEEFTVKSGEIFSLDAGGTSDPDGDNLSYWWFQYPEAGSYDKEIILRLAENLYNVHTIVAPEVEKPETIHFILKVTDKGKPALSRYKRVIVNVVPD